MNTWPCDRCLVINTFSVKRCKNCGSERYEPPKIEIHTPALDSLIADIEYAKNNSLLRDNSDPIFFKLAEALTEIRALLKSEGK